MKKIKWHLLLLAAFGICAGYANKPKKFLTAKGQEMDTYAYWYTADSKMYYGYDLTTMGWIQGLDYDCEGGNYICTFIADPTRAHEDETGVWFYTWDVPTPGINYEGAFQVWE